MHAAEKTCFVHQNKLHNDKMASHIFVFLYFVRLFFFIYHLLLALKRTVEVKRHQNLSAYKLILYKNSTLVSKLRLDHIYVKMSRSCNGRIMILA